MRHVRPRLLAIIALGLAGCGSATEPAPSGGAPREITALPRTLSANDQLVIRASNGFGFGMLRQLDRTAPAGNLFLSPLSASMALGMAMNGVAGTAFDEMRATLGFETAPLAGEPGQVRASHVLRG